MPCLRALRPELRVVSLPVSPTGLTLVTGLDPNSHKLRTRRQDILTATHGDAAGLWSCTQAVMGPLGVNRREWVADWLSEVGGDDAAEMLLQQALAVQVVFGGD